MAHDPASASSPYRGDSALGAQLAAAHSSFQVKNLRELVLGVLAAPPQLDPARWTRLVCEAPSPELVDQLQAFRAEVAKGLTDGLGVAPAPGERVVALRTELARRGLAGFIVPRVDEHQNEYVPKHAQRLSWLTGFSGSWGVAAVLRDCAALFVDGRYTLQAREETDVAVFEQRHLVDQPLTAWLQTKLVRGDKLGFDPWLHGADEAAQLAAACAQVGAELVPVEQNLVDLVWRDRPAAPIAPATIQTVEHAGRASSDKRRELARRLVDKGAAAAVLTLPDSLCWLLNIRGGDLPCTPFVLALGLLRADGSVDLYVDARKLTALVRAHLGPDVRVRPFAEFESAVRALATQKATVVLDPVTAPSWISKCIEAGGGRVLAEGDPCVLPKACKNAAELAGTRAAHVRDGAAMARFLAWFAREAPRGELSELDVVARLGAIRREAPEFRDDSFETISGAGPNGAIVHYRVSPKSNRRIERDSVFLLDSGAQYQDGTTDITRTLAVGRPSDEARDRFTRVLRGHIALATARFPVGTVGMQLDTLARHALWQVGLDYDHGTGHGVGSYLSVHEGPQRISKVAKVPLQVGMILSNEPGYYKAGAYGIRIENLVVVERVELPGAERELLGFETITLCPIDRHMLELSQLSSEERRWLDAYHARVRQALAPRLSGPDLEWLGQATAALG